MHDFYGDNSSARELSEPLDAVTAAGKLMAVPLPAGTMAVVTLCRPLWVLACEGREGVFSSSAAESEVSE
jgi:hypothetical protein